MATLIPGGLRTTAMGILPHTEVEPALKLALSLDIPFWPQLPHLSYYEDMYVQASENFPGIFLDLEKTVEKAFRRVLEMSLRMRDQNQLGS